MEEQTDKLNNRDNYIQNAQQQIEAFMIYKKVEFSVQKAQAAQEAEKPVEETKGTDEKEMKPFSTQTAVIGGVENKVVECSILHVVQTEQKQTQASAAVEHKPEVLKVQQQPVTLLAHDHTVEEALHMLVPIFLVLPQAMTIMGPNQLFM